MRVGFGLARLHHIFSRSGRERLLRGAFDAGCAHFDVAPAYGDGLAEAEFGRVLGRFRDQITLGTKFGIPCSGWGARSEAFYYLRKALSRPLGRDYGVQFSRRDFTATAAIASLENSLRRLRTDCVDFFFLHEPRYLGELGRVVELVVALEGQKRAGKLRHYGIAAPAPLVIEARLNRLPCGDAVQFEISAQSPELIQTAVSPSRMFGYGLIRHLRPNPSAPRLEFGEVFRWFHGFVPGVIPIISTNRAEELERLGRAIASIG